MDTDLTTVTYATFTENNEWEGETWHFYIPINGNEAALARLAAILNPDSESYELDLSPLTADQVDTLVKYGNDAEYMAGHNKLEGKLTFLGDEEITEENDPLCKGGIGDFMSAAT